jgi:hypothetical protein
MIPTTARYKKIRSLILDHLSQKNGVDKATELLNRNLFTAPCGRKGRWTPEQVRQIILGETCNPYTVSMSVLVAEDVHKKVKATGSISDFLREAINEKIRRDGLT